MRRSFVPTGIILAIGLSSMACSKSSSEPTTPAATSVPQAATPGEDMQHDMTKPAEAGSESAALVAPGEAKVGDRSTCPVTGEEFTVSNESPKVDHNGKTYYFCCPGCNTAFAKEPEKYLTKLSQAPASSAK